MNYSHEQKVKNRLKVPNDFELVNKTKIFDFLDRIEPFGGTSMRDAVAIGIDKVKFISEKNSLISKNSNKVNPGEISPSDKYSFKIIVVTDGEDNCSFLTAPILSQYLRDVTKNTPIDDLNLLFVTVDLNKHDQANLDIIGISHNSASHCKKVQAKSEELVEVFEKEIFQYEERTEVEEVRIVDNVEITVKETRIKAVEIKADKRFAVTFVIDISYSMKGSRWDSLKAAIRNIKEKLSRNPENMVDLILFNNSVFHYTHPHFNKKFSYDLCKTFCSTKPLLCFFFCLICSPCCMSECALSKAEGRDFRFSGLLLTLICAPIGLALNRRKLKKKYNIPGYCIIDCCLEPFCCFCMTSQEWAEARYRGEGLVF